MNTEFAKFVRQRAQKAFSALTLPDVPVDQVSVRDDRVLEYSLSWRVRGDDENGLMANITDRNDLIEFGLLAHTEGVPANILHVILVLDDVRERATDATKIVTLSSSSEQDDYTYQATLTLDALEPLDRALAYFAQGLGQID